MNEFIGKHSEAVSLFEEIAGGADSGWTVRSGDTQFSVYALLYQADRGIFVRGDRKDQTWHVSLHGDAPNEWIDVPTDDLMPTLQACTEQVA